MHAWIPTPPGPDPPRADTPPPPGPGRHPPRPGRHPPGPGRPPWTRQTPPPGSDRHPPDQADTPRARPPQPGRHLPPPRKQTPAYGLRVAGTHPTGTGMHSCFTPVCDSFCSGGCHASAMKGGAIKGVL